MPTLSAQLYLAYYHLFVVFLIVQFQPAQLSPQCGDNVGFVWLSSPCRIFQLCSFKLHNYIFYLPLCKDNHFFQNQDKLTVHVQRFMFLTFPFYYLHNFVGIIVIFFNSFFSTKKFKNLYLLSQNHFSIINFHF